MLRYAKILTLINIFIICLVAVEPVVFNRNENRASMKSNFAVIGSTYNDQAHDITGPDQYGGTAMYISNTKPNATNSSGVRAWTFPAEGSISMWLKPDDWRLAGGAPSDGQEHRVLLANSLIWWSYITSSGVWTFDLNGAASERLSIGTVTMESNEWMHIAYCWNSAVTQVLYTNGILAGSRTPGVLGNIGVTNNLALGSYLETTKGWKGWIDNVKIYETCILDWNEEVALFERSTMNDIP